jgi:hypothetical protein
MEIKQEFKQLFHLDLNIYSKLYLNFLFILHILVIILYYSQK